MSDFPGAGTIHKKVAFTPKQYASLSLVYQGTVIYMQAQDHNTGHGIMGTIIRPGLGCDKISDADGLARGLADGPAGAPLSE
jgi:hypothetical protein